MLAVTLENTHRLENFDKVTSETLSFLEREHTRIDSILDWLDTQASPEGFAPGWFSLMDIMLIVHVDFSETRNELKWRGRNNLDKLYTAFANRPSIEQTRYPWMTSEPDSA